MWSWRVGQNQFITPTAYTTGLATATINSPTITGIGTAWTSALVGLQFRFGAVAPIYTVVEVNQLAQTLQIDLPYGGVSGASPTGYQIFQAYLTPPADFQDFISLKDTFNNYRLWLHLTQEELDTYDAQRAWSGTAYGVADYRYSTSPTAGSVGPATMVIGTQGDPAPFLFGTFTGMASAIYSILVQNGGPVGTATFAWSVNGQQLGSNIISSAQGFLMSQGVNIQWPSTVNFIPGDVFVSACSPGFTAQIPMYELWPYCMSPRVYPFLYDRRFPDLDDPNGIVPPFIDADILVKGALADVCRWRGTETKANPMYGLDTAMSFDREFERKVAEMEREDDETYQTSVRYQLSSYGSLGMAPMPFAFGADWAQSHAISA